MSDLLQLLDAPLSAAAGVDPSDPGRAVAELQAAYPFEGSGGLRDALVAAVGEGSLCHKGDEPMKWSRVSKPEGNRFAHSIDAVWMSGAGPRHRHPKGEINLCFAIEGDPRFDGHAEGWVVFPPGSEHVPTVSGGRMLIVYFLPDGAMEWVQDGS